MRAVVKPKIVQISNESKRYYASIDGGPRFYVGKHVKYGTTGVGLANTERVDGNLYVAAEHRDEHGFWADFIDPIGACESGRAFQCVNTYDSARFTFGFLQYASHVPDGDFVTLFRELLRTERGGEYFPDLSLKDGRIHRETERGTIPLETMSSTAALQDYLNPGLKDVEPIEAINAAKFVHWSTSEKQHRTVQVAVGVELMRTNMVLFARRYGLDGVSDILCLIIADIRHQGRAKSTEILAAFSAGKTDAERRENLLRIGQEGYPERIKTLRSSIKVAEAQGTLGKHVYNLAGKDFKKLG